MIRTLLWIGGGLNVLFAALHLTMAFSTGGPGAASLSADLRATMTTLNVSLALALIAFAYLSIFQWKGLSSTTIGRAIGVCISLWWLARIAEEVAFYGLGPGSWILVALCLVIAALYLIPVVVPASSNRTQGIAF